MTLLKPLTISGKSNCPFFCLVKAETAQWRNTARQLQSGKFPRLIILTACSVIQDLSHNVNVQYVKGLW